MTLQETIDKTGAARNDINEGVAQVFPKMCDRQVFYRLSDYVVSSSVSRPSLIMLEAKEL